MILRAALLLAAVGLLGTGTPPPPPGFLAHLDLDDPLSRFRLPGRLAEASGLAFAPDGRLFAHDDERGIVYRVDAATGEVDRGFQVGESLLRDDFEGLAIAGPRFWLVSSTGRLYEFREAAEGERSPVRVTDTGLGQACEVEGLAYHAVSESLLLACKTLPAGVEEVRIHRLPLGPGAAPPPPIRVPWSSFEARGHSGPVSPSGVDVDPTTGSLVLVAARQELLFEVTVDGELLGVRHLSRRRHPQAEGVAVGPDGRLYVADEAAGGRAHLTVYAPRRQVP